MDVDEVIGKIIVREDNKEDPNVCYMCHKKAKGRYAIKLYDYGVPRMHRKALCASCQKAIVKGEL